MFLRPSSKSPAIWPPSSVRLLRASTNASAIPECCCPNWSHTEDRDSWLPAVEVAFESLKACSEAVYDVWAIQREAVEATVAAYSAVVATRTGDSVTTAVGAHRAHLATHPIFMETMDAWTGAYEAFSAASESQTEEQVIRNAQSVEVHRREAEAALDRIRSAQD